MPAQPEPNPSEGGGGSAASFPSDAHFPPNRAHASAVVLPLRPAKAHAPNLGDGDVYEASGSRAGAARGLLLGLLVGAALWLLIGLAVWRLLLR
jgi:hypothetical protein